MTSLKNNKTTDAVIHFKDGKRKHGLLIDESPDTEHYLFIPNSSISHFTETQSTEYIEIVPGTLIEAIETDLK